MNILKFTLNLLKHSGILVLRVLGILLPAVGGALASGAARKNQTDDAEYGCFPDGSPYYENAAHEQWEAYYGEKR